MAGAGCRKQPRRGVRGVCGRPQPRRGAPRALFDHSPTLSTASDRCCDRPGARLRAGRPPRIRHAATASTPHVCRARLRPAAPAGSAGCRNSPRFTGSPRGTRSLQNVLEEKRQTLAIKCPGPSGLPHPAAAAGGLAKSGGSAAWAGAGWVSWPCAIRKGEDTKMPQVDRVSKADASCVAAKRVHLATRARRRFLTAGGPGARVLCHPATDPHRARRTGQQARVPASTAEDGEAAFSGCEIINKESCGLRFLQVFAR